MASGEKETVRHEGVVVSIDGRECIVRILQSSACQTCAAHQLCSSSESKEKLVRVRKGAEGVAVGQTVVIEGSVSQGLRAVGVAYVLPLALGLVSLAFGVSLWGEGVGALLSLSTMAAYYVVLYLLRDRLDGRFTFSIVKA